MPDTRTVLRTCPLCEATCGLELTLEGDKLTRVRGDDDDVFSHGYICPKGVAYVDLENDERIIRRPLIREGDEHREATWEEAFTRIEASMRPIIEEHGRDAVAVYLGNPTVHNLSATLYGRVLLRALGTRNIYTASTVDQIPKQLASGLMFGNGLTVAIPDIDRTQYMLMLGANPYVSNGSLFTAPDLPGRLRALRKRGGKLVVIDPRVTQTAKQADEHHFIVPGTDAHFLFAIVHTLFDENLMSVGAIGDHLNGLDDVRALIPPFSPEAVAPICGIPAAETRRIARELASAGPAVVYARIGTCTQEFGTIASWLVDVINVLIGALDQPGGAMFPTAAAGSPTATGTPGKGRGIAIGRHRSRVRGRAEILGELPVACLAEEILTPGDGRVRALITVAGNPAVSTPDSNELERAMETLELMVSVDIYMNPTTRHADVILPGASSLTRGHYDLAFYQLACRNIANYSPPAVELPDGAMHEWEVLLRLSAIAAGQSPHGSVDGFDELVARDVLQRALQSPASPAHGVDADTAWNAVSHRHGPERVLDIQLRAGPYGEAFGRNPDGVTLEKLEANPHGIDFGPMVPRIPEVLRTPSGKIELAPEPIVADVDRLRASMARTRNGGFVLIGRRQLRSNNSWMHGLKTLTGGANRCTMLIHPDDAAHLGIEDGKQARVTSSSGALDVPAEVSDEMMRGVVSIPHGWSNGENSNVLAPSDLIDELSGNAVLNGIPVEVAPA